MALVHTIVPAKDKVVSAGFFAEIYGLTVKLGQGHFAQVRVNESLIFDFAESRNPRAITTRFRLTKWSSSRSLVG